jgi:hypothetical protein
VIPVEWTRHDRSVSKNTILSRKIPSAPVMNKNDNACGRRNGTVEVVNAGAVIIPETPTVKTSNDPTLA